MPFYDNFSMQGPTSLGAFIADREARNCLTTILKLFKEANSLLEIGPGRGAFARSCLNINLNYTCIDISMPLLRDLSLADKKVQALVPPLPFRSESFDIAYASNLLEHMLDFRTALFLLEEMRRVVRRGGLICHRVPNGMAWGMHFWNGDYTHSFFTTPRTVSQVYLDAGLRIEAVHPVSGFVVGPIGQLVSVIGHLIPTWIVGHGANPTSRLSKVVYSAKTTFLLGFLIIGRKV